MDTDSAKQIRRHTRVTNLSRIILIIRGSSFEYSRSFFTSSSHQEEVLAVVESMHLPPTRDDLHTHLSPLSGYLMSIPH